MNDKYIQPFIDAGQSVISQVTGLNTTLGEIYTKEVPYNSDSVVVLIGLTGQIYGSVIISLTKSLGCKIASIMMMGMPVNELDEIAKSAISELCNMMLGNTAANLYKNNITVDITPPTVFTGSNMQVTPSKAITTCIPFILDDGEIINIDVSYKEK
ncbi:chemotaxis protein CheX [Clostridium grantii]|uniref:Chemotaxis protein CheX n=1 Tax=Clostridium grantii DSM 8605 TaxID=1121316 RepID=A0A1M5W6J6_9CLOT|nr:chemotaxis protein CheX [Clostridium grantii]SHH83107.1 chemotaxis protein CheX [Clostridium grantii DSM 8605]